MRGKRKPSKVVDISTWRKKPEEPRLAVIRYEWLAPDGEVDFRGRDWERPCTSEAIAEWVEEYRRMVADGYRPKGFDYVPMPMSASVIVDGVVVAEWGKTAKVFNGKVLTVRDLPPHLRRKGGK